MVLAKPALPKPRHTCQLAIRTISAHAALQQHFQTLPLGTLYGKTVGDTLRLGMESVSARDESEVLPPRLTEGRRRGGELREYGRLLPGPLLSETHSAEDTYILYRFIEAQETTYPLALREVSSGQKRSHWMWYVFPIAEGLGHSATSRRYAIHSREEAAAYLAHPVLGERLKEITHALLLLDEGTTAKAVSGNTDAWKLRASLTLFAAVSPNDDIFTPALTRYYGSRRCRRTLSWLGMTATT